MVNFAINQYPSTMSFIDKILSVFKNSNGTASRSTEAQPNPFKIHTSINIEGTCFSTDFKTFYLIDNGNIIDFPLDTPSGLVIGEIFGRLTFAAQVRNTTIPSGQTLPQLLQQKSEEAAVAVDTLSLSLANGRWTVQYFPKEKILAVMGATDLDAFFEGEEKDPEKITPKIGLVPTKSTIKIFNRGTEIVVNGTGISTSGFNKEVAL